MRLAKAVLNLVKTLVELNSKSRELKRMHRRVVKDEK